MTMKKLGTMNITEEFKEFMCLFYVFTDFDETVTGIFV